MFQHNLCSLHLKFQPESLPWKADADIIPLIKQKSYLREREVEIPLIYGCLPESLNFVYIPCTLKHSTVNNFVQQCCALQSNTLFFVTCNKLVYTHGCVDSADSCELQ